jgi:hypothetical protein
MRGQFPDQGGMFSCIHPAKRINANHPLRRICELVREIFIPHPSPIFAEGNRPLNVVLFCFFFLT